MNAAQSSAVCTGGHKVCISFPFDNKAFRCCNKINDTMRFFVKIDRHRTFDIIGQNEIDTAESRRRKKHRTYIAVNDLYAHRSSFRLQNGGTENTRRQQATANYQIPFPQCSLPFFSP